MRLFIQKVLLLCAVVLFIALTLSYFPGWRYEFKNGETESNLYLLPHDQDFDLVLLGTSHGKIFSRSGNHDRVEKILNAKMQNLSTGGGRGIYAAKLFLDYFFFRGNDTRTIVYFIDPWVLYSPKWNEENDLFGKEPLDFTFLSFLVKERVNPTILANYVRTKVTWSWFLQTPSSKTEELGTLDGINPEAVKRRVGSLYPDGLKEENFRKYKEYLIYISELAKKRKIRLIFVTPTTLLGNLRGEETLKTTLSLIQRDYGAEYYDFSEVIKEPALYSDHDHLNTAGVVLFTEKYLAPILRQR